MLYRDHFQNYKQYNIPKAQLVIAHETGRKTFGFKIKKEYYEKANAWLAEVTAQQRLFAIG
jgi:hypothetical protein